MISNLKLKITQFWISRLQQKFLANIILILLISPLISRLIHSLKQIIKYQVSFLRLKKKKILKAHLFKNFMESQRLQSFFLMISLDSSSQLKYNLRLNIKKMLYLFKRMILKTPITSFLMFGVLFQYKQKMVLLTWPLLHFLLQFQLKLKEYLRHQNPKEQMTENQNLFI